MKAVSEMPVGGKFIYDGKEMLVISKRGTVVQAEFVGIEGFSQIFFGFEMVEPIE